MATHDYVIDNSTGANVRADINNVLQAILTNNSSSSAPSTTAAYMFWADTTSGTLKIRNSSDNAWVELLQLDGTLTLEDGAVGTPALAFRDDLDTGIYSSAANTFNVATGGVERMELGTTTVFNEDGADVDFRIEGDTENNLFYVDAGNDQIGIGVTIPRQKLHIGGSDSGSVNMVFTNSTTGNSAGDGFIVGITGGEDAQLNMQESANLKFSTADTERMRIDSSGRILKGFSASAPAFGVDSAMQIVGTSFADSSLMLRRDANSANPAGLVFAKSRSSSKGGNTVVQNGDQLGTIVFTAADGSDLVSDGAQIRAKIDGTPGSNDVPTRLEFLTAPDGGSSVSERMRIDKNGNVSIGTASTSNRFHVEGTTAGSRFGVDVSTSGIACIAATNESNADVELVIYDGRSSIGSSVNIPLAFHTNGKTNEKMRLQTSGALCIGSSNSQQVASGFPKLQIQSNDSTGRLSVIQHRNEVGAAPFITLGKSRATSVNNVTAVQDGDTLGTIAWVGGDGSTLNTSPIQLVGIVDGAVTTGEIAGTLVFKTMQTGSSSLAEKMRLTHNGYLGINNTSPAYKLDISTAGAVGARIRQTTNNTGVDHALMLCRHAAAISGQNGIDFIFQNSGGTAVGQIDHGQSTTQYRTSSDYRLKENAVAISDGITRLKTLKPYRFNFIAEPDKTVDGFYAHEVTAVPEAISGTKDEVDSDNNPVYQGIDHSKLVPLLVAAVKELITKVEALEAA